MGSGVEMAAVARLIDLRWFVLLATVSSSKQESEMIRFAVWEDDLGSCVL